MGLHVYAITLSGGIDLPPLSGILDEPVAALRAGSLAAIVSRSDVAALRAERRHILASQRVLNTLSARGDLLPMAFGTVAASDEELIRFIDGHREALAAQLGRVAGKVEMSVRMALDVADPIAFIVAATPVLKQARDRVFRGGRSPSYDEQIKLGELCDDSLRRYREHQAEHLSALLGPVCADIAPQPLRRDRDVAHLAALVPRTANIVFEDAVADAAVQLPDELTLTIGGPWPPYNFVQVSL